MTTNISPLATYGTQQYDDALKSYSTFLKSEYGTLDNYTNSLTTQVNSLTNNDSFMNVQVESNKFKNTNASLFKAQELLNDVNAYSNALLGFGSAAALDAAKAIKPAQNGFLLNYNHATGTFVSSSAAGNYYVLKNVGKIAGKIVLPAALTFAATEAGLAIANGNSSEAAKITAKTALAVASGLAAAALLPASVPALAVIGLGAGAAALNS